LEPVDRDEAFSWNAATVIMLLFSLFALTMTLLGINPFTLLFNVALVYLPTAILLGSTLFKTTKRSS
jgi:isoprenylcysteine carboxyl methyltransferase (ICMT) family protein YpbQ